MGLINYFLELDIWDCCTVLLYRKKSSLDMLNISWKFDRLFNGNYLKNLGMHHVLSMETISFHNIRKIQSSSHQIHQTKEWHLQHICFRYSLWHKQSIGKITQSVTAKIYNRLLWHVSKSSKYKILINLISNIKNKYIFWCMILWKRNKKKRKKKILLYFAYNIGNSYYCLPEVLLTFAISLKHYSLY